MAQLKMYWFTKNPIEEFTLPEGYSFSHFSEKNRDVDIRDWNECIRTWTESDMSDEERFKREIYDFKEIVPEEDVWFLDYNGEHIGTATSFIFAETGIGDMHWVGIKSSFRGKGLAKYLSNKIQVTLKNRGVEIVSLTSGEGRPAAVKSYITAGFQPVEYDVEMQDRWEIFMDTLGVDTLDMVKNDGTPYKTIYRRKSSYEDGGAI